MRRFLTELVAFSTLVVALGGLTVMAQALMAE